MARLSLSLLGAPEARHGDQRVAFRTRKALALLAYLAVEGGTVSRDKLTALLWPDSDEAHGRMMLRRTLAFLRQNLGDDAAGAAAHVSVTREALGLQREAGWDLDVEQLERALPRRAGQAVSTAALREAVTRYRGDFLDGFSLGDAAEFDDWVAVQREYWRQRIGLACDQLTQSQIESGDRSGALATLGRWVALDPLNETAYQRLMQAHLAAGDRAAALQAFEAVRAALARELAVEPAPETLALAERARTLGAPAAGRPPPVAAGPASLAEGPLVGRAEEFGRLIAAFHAARQGRPQCVVLEGEAGIGKSRLATEFLAWTAGQGALVLHGQAFETGGRLPFQGIVEALRAGLALQAGQPPELGDVWLGEMARLLPELGDRHAAPAQAQDQAAAQMRLYEAVARWGQALAARAPLLVFIDDAQWADSASLDLLHYCARRWSAMGASILLVAALRSEALAALGVGGALADWLGGLQRDLPVLRLPLGPLGLADIRHYLEELTGQPETQPALDGFASWLFAETSGQPFFIVETLKALVQQSAVGLRPSAAGWRLDLGEGPAGLENVLPPGVRELVRARLARLRPEAFGLLAAGAVLGQNFTFETLCQVAALAAESGLAAWDELLGSGLLTATGSPATDHPTPRRYRFSHDKIRDVTYTEAGEARRRVFHGRALKMLEDEGAPAAELAHHAMAAGLPEATYRHSLAAGDEAMRVYAVRDAVAHYQQAQAAADALPPPPSLGQLSNRLARALEAAGDYAEARVTYLAALELARAARDPQLECVTLNRLATLAGIHNFENPEVGQYLQQALNVAEASGDTLGRAETEWNLAHFAFYAGQMEPARAHGRRALASAVEIGADELAARSLNVLAYTELGANLWAAAEGYAEQAQARYAALGDRAGVADSLLQLANSRLNSGQLRAGIEAARAGRAINKEIENIWGLVLSDIHLAHGLRSAGELDEALAVASEGARLGRELGMNALSIFMLAELGAVHRSRGELAAARAVHEEAEAINQRFPTQPFTELVAAEKCADLALAGDWSAAGEYARQALASRGRVTVPFFGLTLGLETAALIRAGDIETARREVERFGAAHGDNPRLRVPYLWAVGALAAADGQLDAAQAHWHSAAALARELGLQTETGQIEAWSANHA